MVEHINTRKFAANLLCKWQQGQADTVRKTFADILLTSELPAVPEQQRAYVTGAFYGVIERLITLDFLISENLTGKIEKLDVFVWNVLRLALFECFYMDSIPESAAVNEAVKLIKSSRQKYAASLVNAVLRSALRRGPKLPEGNSPEELSIRFSCGKWLVSSFIEDYGLDTAIGLLSQSLIRPPVYIRVNTLKTTSDKLTEALSDEGVTASAADISDTLIIERDGTVLTSTAAFKSGLFYVQDKASVICAAAVPQGAIRILDLCAAPGGKTFSAAINNPAAEVISCDLSEPRLKLVGGGLERLSIRNVKTVVNDASVFNKDLGLFDCVICDVPCSGFGTMAKKPDIKYKPESEIEGLPAIQRKIINTATRYVAPGGRLIYSTCTVRKCENDDIAADFLAENAGFSPEDGILPYTENHTLQLFPHIHNTDGFYVAAFKKEVI